MIILCYLKTTAESYKIGDITAMAERRIKISGDLTSDDKFKEKMEEIKDIGFIKSHRDGDTGVGKTLEDELGIEENSISASDIGGVELKASRIGANKKVTLLTKAPSKRGGNNRILRARYGYQTDKSRKINEDVKVLHTSVNGKDFNSLNGEPFMKLTSKGDRIYLEHAKDGLLEDIYWEKDQLEAACKKKYPEGKMYHVQAESKIEDGKEYFHYVEAYSLENFSAEKLIEGLVSGDLEIDIRLGVHASGNNKGKPHDNGTAIRVSYNKLNDCFDTRTPLL